MARLTPHLLYISLGLGVGYFIGLSQRGETLTTRLRDSSRELGNQLLKRGHKAAGGPSKKLSDKRIVSEGVPSPSQVIDYNAKNPNQETSHGRASDPGKKEAPTSGLPGAAPKIASQTPHGTLPKVRLLNAYRTRTFWTPGLIANDVQNFTIVIEKDDSLDRSYRPRIDWKVGSAQGTLWGDATKRLQTILLPRSAWRLDEPAVEVGLKVGAAREGENFEWPPEKATLTIKSLATALEKGGLLHISSKKRAGSHASGWLSNWNQVKPGPNTLSIYMDADADPQALWPLLQSAEDFSLEPGPPPKEPMELFAAQDQVMFGIVRGSLPSVQRTKLLKDLGIVLTYRGLPQHYLGELRGNPRAIAARVKSLAVAETVVIFRSHAQTPFGAVKTVLIIPRNVELLRKEGVALFTQPVEGVTYFGH